MYAAYGGRVKVIDWLLQYGNLDKQAKDKSGCDVLMTMAAAGRYDMVVKFREEKLSVDATTPEGDTALLLAARYGRKKVVQFLVENSLGKLYLEMYPDSEIKRRYKIANAPPTQERPPKPLLEVTSIDPACGSGNFLLYAFDFFYELYIDQIDHYGAKYDKKEIPKLIIVISPHHV